MIDLIKKVTPLKIKKVINRQFAKSRRAVDQRIPRYELSRKHIANLKAVENRNVLLEYLPRNGTVAEIGVDCGEYSAQILKISQPAKLHLIDLWSSEGYPSGRMDQVQKRFEKEIAQKQVEINVGMSVDLGQRFPDHYFDWVYLDTAHTYEVVSAELEIYSHKVKPEGIIAGHDFILGHWINGNRYGVIEAVYEHCYKRDWELIYLSMENQGPASFAIRKIP